MASLKKWICNGIPKNGKEYPGLGVPHLPLASYADICIQCGLPRESAIPDPIPKFRIFLNNILFLFKNILQLNQSTRSSNHWICDGIPKNRKKYPGLGGAHGLYENDSPYCDDCGLPRESSIPSGLIGFPAIRTSQPIPESKPIPMKDSNIIASRIGAGKSQFTDKTPKYFMNQKLITKLLWLPNKICAFIKTVKNIM